MRGFGHAFFDRRKIMYLESFVADGKYKQKNQYRLLRSDCEGAEAFIENRLKGDDLRNFKLYVEKVNKFISLVEEESFKEGVKKGIKFMQEME